MSGSLELVLAAITQIGERIGHMDERIGLVDERIGGLDARVDGLSGELKLLRVEVMARLDRRQDILTTIKDDMNVNVAAVDNVRDRHKQIQNDHDQLAHQVSLVHRRLIQLEQRFDSKEHGT